MEYGGGQVVRLSRKGEYALRAMIVLAAEYGNGPIDSQTVADRERIPKKFLGQILLELKNAGILQSRRGPRGGYYMIRAPKDVTLAEVVRAIDGPLAPLSCVSKMAHERCPEEESCGLWAVMMDVRNAIARTLEGVTFEDICGGARK